MCGVSTLLNLWVAFENDLQKSNLDSIFLGRQEMAKINKSPG